MDLNDFFEIETWQWPEEAGDIFLKAIKNPQTDLSDRLLAAELAGGIEVMNDDIAKALLSILHNADEPEDLRKTAALSLGPVLEYVDVYLDEDDEEETISTGMFRSIQDTFHEMYPDESIPVEVRRSILEAAVRAPQDWHTEAVRSAYAMDDDEWYLTAVFCMRYVKGFNDQIIDALKHENEDIHYHAVCAAGNWELKKAWSHIESLLVEEMTDKSLLLAAMEAAVNIHPKKTAALLGDFLESDDEDIVDAAYEAINMAEALTGFSTFGGDDSFL